MTPAPIFPANPSQREPYPVTLYRDALRLAWKEVFDDAPVLIDLDTPLVEGSVADQALSHGVRIAGWNLGIAQIGEDNWVVGHIGPLGDLTPSSHPVGTVEECIAALLGMIANIKACRLLFDLDVRVEPVTRREVG